MFFSEDALLIHDTGRRRLPKCSDSEKNHTNRKKEEQNICHHKDIIRLAQIFFQKNPSEAKVVTIMNTAGIRVKKYFFRFKRSQLERAINLRAARS